MKQIEIPGAFEVLLERRVHRYKLFHGGRGGAKSHTVARALLVLASQEKFRMLCAREIQNSIKDSVHKLLSDVIKEHELNYFHITNDAIVNRINGSEFIFRGLYRNAHEIKSLEGIDYCWVEEAQSISNESLKILIPTIRKQDSEIWFTYNRFLEHDPVHDRFAVNPDKKTFVKKVSFRDNPYFNQTLREEMERDKERDYDEYLHVWEGEPLYQSEDSLMSRVDVKAAMERIVKAEGGIEVGVDVARFGKDKTILYKRKGFQVIDTKPYKKLGVNEVANKVKMFCEPEDFIKVDATGVGGGVADILRSDNYDAVDINFGASPKDKDKYDMLISEAWFEFKKILPYVGLIYDSDLFDELVNRKWRIDKKGRRCIESKDDYKKRGNASPDKADALLLCFYTYHNYGKFGATTKPTHPREARVKDINSKVASRIKISKY